MHVTEQQGISRELHLPIFPFSYLSTPHGTTNCTPSSLFVQRELLTGLDPLCADHVTQKQGQQSRNYDVHAKPHEFTLVQVWLEISDMEQSGVLGFYSVIVRTCTQFVCPLVSAGIIILTIFASDKLLLTSRSRQ